MAGRKSKTKLYTISDSIVWKTAIYCRLSNDDGTREESNSIINQKSIIENYLKDEADVSIIDYYVDDGYSGTNFERPGFKKMYNDILLGKINFVIVKDLSRFGRNFTDVGKYLEEIFPLNNIRFISIGDNIDSYKNPESMSDMIVQFKNLMNDEYARDVSKKVRNAYLTMAREGKYVGGTTPYGYIKNPDNKHQLIINDAEAKIVKLIFNMVRNGDGSVKITKFLNENGYYCRREIQRRNKLNIPIDDNTVSVEHRFGTSNIEKIITNENYIGSLVSGKTTNISYKNKTIIYKPREEWIIVPNTHEPIIEEKLFYEVQSIYKERVKGKNRNSKNCKETIYKGKIICGNCGRAMIKQEDYRRKVPRLNYYCFSGNNLGTGCTTHRIDATVLENLLIEIIIMQIKQVISVETILNKYNNNNSLAEIELETNTRINSIMKIQDRNKLSKKKIYEDWKFNKITKEEFMESSKTINKKIEEYNSEIEAIKINYEEIIKKQKSNDYWVEHFRRNKKVKVLNKEIIDELIEEIVIYQGNKVKVKFKYDNEYKEALKLVESMKGEQLCQDGKLQFI